MTTLPPVVYPIAGPLGGSGGAMFADAVNFDGAHLPNFRKAVVDTLFGVSDTIINFAGDSTDAGVIAIGGAAAVYTNGRVQSMPALLAQYLNSLGIPSIADNWFGDAASSTHSSTLAAYYPQVTLGSGWASFTGGGVGLVPGGYAIANSTTTNNLATASRSQCDSATIFYLQSPSTGSFTWQADSGTVSGAINTSNGTSGIATLNVSLGSVGTHTLNIARTAGSVYIVGVDFYNSTKKQIRVRNLGVGGSQTSDWVYTNYGWSIGNQINKAAYAAALTFVGPGINDWINAAGASNTQTNLISLYGKIATAGGDIVIVDPLPSNTSAVSAATQAQYTSVIKALALSQNLAMFDLNLRMVNYGTAVAQGFMGAGDNYHGTFEGYGDAARRLAHLLMNAT